MNQSNIELNLAGLQQELKSTPAATHCLLRRQDGVLVDIPIDQAEATIRRHDDWVFEGVAVPQIELAPPTVAAQSAQEELPVLPPLPSEEQPQLQSAEPAESTPVPSEKPKKKTTKRKATPRKKK